MPNSIIRSIRFVNSLLQSSFVVGNGRKTCFVDFEGKETMHKFLQVDVNECLMQPCYNNATCLQRSNQSLYGNVINTSFTYTQAAGFVCLCAAGWLGYCFFLATRSATTVFC